LCADNPYFEIMLRDRPRLKPVTGDRREPMQRVRLGITGLAAVILLVALATAIASGIRRTANGQAAPSSAPALNDPGNVTAPRAEPLEQLGVAPPTVEKPDPGAPKPAR
jgi:hypothetical protein